MPRPHGNCKFRNEWLAIDKLKDWVARDRTDDQVAKCTLCMKTVRIANAGKHALESHLRSAQHQRCERAASTSVVNVLAPQRRVTVPVLHRHRATRDVKRERFRLASLPKVQPVSTPVTSPSFLISCHN